MEDQEDDEDEKGGLYEGGHWLWDDKHEELVFISDLPVIRDIPITTAIVGAVEFKEDIDLNEQQRYRKRMQRKAQPNEEDIVTLQDVKDVVLFTAPIRIINPMLISLLHQPATERLLRGLIVFCQYHLQIADVMAQRKKELETKVHTPYSDKIELQFQENLEDLRLLVAKEYSNFLLGSGEFAKFHHMGPCKSLRSLSKRDSILFETFIRFCVQIVWVALGRKSFTQIELEVNRIFKSHLFNSAQHKLNKDAMSKLQEQMSVVDRKVLRGHCMRKQHKVNIISPLLSEVHCSRQIDHQIYGLGFIKYPWLNPRLSYLEYVLILPENLLDRNHMSIGILGLPRSRFDILLKEIKFTSNQASASNVSITRQAKISSSKSARRKSFMVGPLYRDIEIPSKRVEDVIFQFPSESLPRRPCDDVQRQKWINRYKRLTAKYRTKSLY